MEETARKNFRMLLRQSSVVGLAPIAAATGVAESTVMRWRDKTEHGEPGQWERFATALAVMNLKIVPANFHCFRQEEIEALLTQARAYMRHLRSVDELVFDEPE